VTVGVCRSRSRDSGRHSDFYYPGAGRMVLFPGDRAGWFQHRVRMRNAIAHGHNMVVAPSWALGTLQQSTLTLNELYPDAETTVHDDRMRREREARAEEWWRDIDDMLRSSAADEPSAEDIDEEQ
jgi:hypothetical protein